MENQTKFETNIKFKASDIVKISFAWYTGKMLFDITMGIVAGLSKKANKKLEEEAKKIKIVRNEDEQ